jgi:hypothetical protein
MISASFGVESPGWDEIEGEGPTLAMGGGREATVGEGVDVIGGDNWDKI